MLKEKLSSLPLQPGCYLMKDSKGEIIYIGKAKKLKARLNQYFTGAHEGKTQKMVSLIEDFDFYVTNTEKEALVLEINLIKQYRPRYNIMFMDDKSYPYIKITSDDYPQLIVVRDKKKDKKAKYFGPFTDTGAARDTVKLLNDLYPIRKCKTMPKKVCLYYHIGQCLGPCQFDIGKEQYASMIDEISRFLKGDNKAQLNRLHKEMDEAIGVLAYEKAAKIRDMIRSIEHISQKQQVQFGEQMQQDVFAYAISKNILSITGFFVRDGKLIQKTSIVQPTVETAGDAFASYLIQFYSDMPKPKELLVPDEVDVDLLSEILNMPVVAPQRGDKFKLVQMAQNNAREQLSLKFKMIEKSEMFGDVATKQLSDLLKVSTLSRIELFDNSHISGSFLVAGMVVFTDGKPNRSQYRRYRLSGGNNDVGSMKEVLYRRLQRMLREDGEKPDLIIVDGGLPQLGAAKEIIESLHLDIPYIALAKDSKHQTDSILLSSEEEVKLLPGEPLTMFLSTMQDEVHRFAVTYHRLLRQKASTRSILDEIDGIGEKRKKELLKHFGSLKAIKEADEQQLSEVVGRPTAIAMIQFFRDLKEGEQE
ncbi:MAG: excinuclease ABC subunit C [Firmicutes bacterium HGW-Firmicutes-19]|nr:MAG: excinuclease ABC subunit C [Firmicutes bacterium HGW-Firmicutes-19]